MDMNMQTASLLLEAVNMWLKIKEEKGYYQNKDNISVNRKNMIKIKGDLQAYIDRSIDS